MDAVHAAVRALDHSYVAVQGPPGAGKTFLASHVIARLVAEGAKVGVVAQSHAVIENLMLACCARDGFDVSRAVRLRGKSVTPDAPWSEVSDSELVELISGAGGLLFGGTVWDYVSERRVPAGSLDVLVVDEAGQFSLTNTVAAARAARSVLLLGDPQQLPQVSTGVHPYPVDVSALGWLSDGAAALNPRFGYFLGESWRMDSALCELVSWLSYDGALASAAATAGRTLQGVAPGVVSYPVEHAGCSVRSVQEAHAVVNCVRELLGREWVPAAGAEPVSYTHLAVARSRGSLPRRPCRRRQARAGAAPGAAPPPAHGLAARHPRARCRARRFRLAAAPVRKLREPARRGSLHRGRRCV